MPIPRGIVSKQRSLAAKLRRTKKNSKLSNFNKFALIGKNATANRKRSTSKNSPPLAKNLTSRRNSVVNNFNVPSRTPKFLL